MLATAVALHDVKDTEAFVQAAINASGRFYQIEEREELAAEGLEIMVDLAGKFEPHRAGYEHEGRFSGYAAKYLRLKLEDRYHRMHPEHLLRTQPDGTRRYEYRDRAVSLDALTGEDPDRHDLIADRREQADLKTRLHTALFERMCEEVKVIVEVGELLSENATPADVAQMLGLTAQQVRDAMNKIAPVISRLQSEEA